MKIIDEAAIKALVSSARASKRKRQNRNLHDNLEDRCQRLLNAIEPDSYLRPHRHVVDPKPETFIAITGTVAVIVFDDAGQVTDSVLLGPNQDVRCIDLPVGTWHSVVSLEEGSVLFETKQGPYVPLAGDDLAPWAPAEGSPEAPAYLEALRRTVVRLPGT